MESMKEKFAKLLLGEDMSGCGKGVSSALALSNSITNLSVSVIGEHRKLEPMPAETKARWRREIEWKLSVTDYIVNLESSQQCMNDGTTVDVMKPKQRKDLSDNIPILRKLDAMLMECLDSFKDQNEFYYTSKNDPSNKVDNRRDDKWWRPVPKVVPNGISETTRKWLNIQKESLGQVLKAAMTINSEVLSQMEIPEDYIESLPKNGRASLGDSIYKSITDEFFDPDYFLSSMDLSSEHKILDLKNKIEASVVIWNRKVNEKTGKSAWTSGVSLGKREQFEDRAETLLLLLKCRYPGLPQSSLDISKIAHNRDVGQAIVESYSRVIESSAHLVMTGIEDVLNADEQARNPSPKEKKTITFNDPARSPNINEELEKQKSPDTQVSMTLSDVMGWNLDRKETLDRKDYMDDYSTNIDAVASKPKAASNRRFSYIETLGGLRSPTARH